jgi:hypothetical protein
MSQIANSLCFGTSVSTKGQYHEWLVIVHGRAWSKNAILRMLYILRASPLTLHMRLHLQLPSTTQMQETAPLILANFRFGIEMQIEQKVFGWEFKTKRQSDVSPTWHHFGGKHQRSKESEKYWPRVNVIEMPVRPTLGNDPNHQMKLKGELMLWRTTWEGKLLREGLLQGFNLPQIALNWSLCFGL